MVTEITGASFVITVFPAETNVLVSVSPCPVGAAFVPPSKRKDAVVGAEVTPVARSAFTDVKSKASPSPLIVLFPKVIDGKLNDVRLVQLEKLQSPPEDVSAAKESEVMFGRLLAFKPEPQVCSAEKSIDVAVAPEIFKSPLTAVRLGNEIELQPVQPDKMASFPITSSNGNDGVESPDSPAIFKYPETVVRTEKTMVDNDDEPLIRMFPETPDKSGKLTDVKAAFVVMLKFPGQEFSFGSDKLVSEALLLKPMFPL